MKKNTIDHPPASPAPAIVSDSASCMRKLGGLFVISSFMVAMPAQAAVLAGYYFNNNWNATVFDSNVTSSSIARVNFSSAPIIASPSYDDGTNTFETRGGYTNNNNTSVTTGSYLAFSFGVEAFATDSYTLDSVTWRSQARAGNGQSYAFTTLLYYSLDGGENWTASDTSNASITVPSGQASGASEWVLGSLSFSPLELNPGDNIDFRLVLTDNSNDTTNDRRARIDAIEIHAIPEPSMALLGGLGMLALLRRRR